MRIAIAAICALVGLAACDAPTPAVKAEPVATPAPVVAPPVETPVVAPPVETPVPEPVVAEAPLAGVGPGGAEGRAARRQAVLDVLGGGSKAAELKLVASDPGRVFDPNLAEEMTPKIEIVVNAVPAVIQRDVKIKGPLDLQIVRRIVRAHINEIRYCYNQGLSKDPNLGGIVTVDFQILGTGKVGDGKVLKSTVPDAAVGACMVVAVKRWSFPKPDKEATVDVSYAFELAPIGSTRSGR